jgi:hypothetical protein
MGEGLPRGEGIVEEVTEGDKVPGFNNGTGIRYRRTCAYGHIATVGRYKMLESKDPYQYWAFMRTLCKNSFYPYPASPRKHRVIYDGEGTLEEIEEKRRKLLSIAADHDKKYPADMWATLTFELGVTGVKVDFYSTIESLLRRNMKGGFIMEATRAGMVRMVWGTKLVRIFHLSLAGVEEYKRLKYELPNSDKKNALIF